MRQAQNIGELSQAQKIGEVDRSEDLEKIRNEITKLEKDLFDLKKDTIACTAPLDGKKEDLLAGTVPTEKCQELPTSTASPEKSTNNLLLDRILASTAPQKSKKLKKLLARPVPPEEGQKTKLLVSPVPQDRHGIALSTRKAKSGKENKRIGVEPQGFNNQIWKSQKEMRRMFLTGKLLCGQTRSETVPTNSLARLASSNSVKPADETNMRMKPMSINCVKKNQMPKLSIEGGGGTSKINILKKMWEQRKGKFRRKFGDSDRFCTAKM